ncbi:prepilin-type N-terminal cleavage/methylation domain-containing protein [Patescibacteria group bacterium]|nr:prepilin-type N-terminal cleavage/methylation domain-containing protein [Patescibacteria group bacterium]
MFVKIKSRKGETLVEVLVALVLLVVGALSALRLLGLASINNQITKERVIATNLAREGLEAVRNIRDTSWLRFAGERRLCWNNLDASSCLDDDSDGIPNDPIIHQKNYLAKFNNTNFRWELDATDLTSRLNLGDGLDADDLKYRLQLNANGVYNHDAAGTDTIYFREIYTEYIEPDQSLAADESANILRVTSKVEWIDRGKISDVTLTTLLTDYLGRKNHD